MAQPKRNHGFGAQPSGPANDNIDTGFYRRGMIYLLRDCVSVGLMEAFDRPPAKHRLTARLGNGQARTLIADDQEQNSR